MVANLNLYLNCKHNFVNLYTLANVIMISVRSLQHSEVFLRKLVSQF